MNKPEPRQYYTAQEIQRYMESRYKEFPRHKNCTYLLQYMRDEMYCDHKGRLCCFDPPQRLADIYAAAKEDDEDPDMGEIRMWELLEIEFGKEFYVEFDW